MSEKTAFFNELGKSGKRLLNNQALIYSNTEVDCYLTKRVKMTKVYATVFE